MRRMILWLDSLDGDDWIEGFWRSAMGGTILMIFSAVVALWRRGEPSGVRWSDVGIATGFLIASLLIVLSCRHAWPKIVQWAKGGIQTPREHLSAPDPFAEAARREVETLLGERSQ